jgi:ankyrin repeat protein
MSTRFLQRRHLGIAFAWFTVAVAAFGAAAFSASWSALAALLLGDAACMLGTSRLVRLRRSTAEIAGAVDYILLLAAYTVLIAVLVGYPMQHLQSEPTLGAALAVSGATVLAMLGLWHLWPAFGLVAFDAAYSLRGPRTRSRLARGIAAARQLSADNELFFSHGLPAALVLSLLVQGALSLAGFAIAVPAQWRVYALVVYALAAPLASWLVLQRCASALLYDCRRERAERVLPASAQPVGAPAVLADDTADINTMLLRCVRSGQVKLALSALEHGADPNGVPPADDRDQRSLLVLAVLHPDMRLLRGLIARGADLNRMHAGLSPLLAATRDSHEGRTEAVTTLLTNGANPNGADADGDTPLHCAALSAKPMVAAMLCDAGAALDVINRAGQTPLGVACEAANWELVRFLLERGAQPDVAHAQPALIAAASIAEDDVVGVKLLLKRKARIDARDALGRTALMAAALHGHAAIAKALLDAGASTNASDKHGTTALMEAARADAGEVIEELALHKPALDLVDHAGRSALMIASQSKRASEDTVRALLALGAARSLAVADGRRAVDFAAAGGRWNIVALLDPDYPRPATISDAPDNAPCAPDSPEHLRDALRFGNWNVVALFADSVREWAQAERAQLFLDLATHSDDATRRWLLNHGLDANAALADGTPLLHAVLAQLPAAAAAAHELIDAGATVGGSECLLRVCAALPADTALENLALELDARGADCFAADADGRGALQYAVAAGCISLTQRLLARGVDPQTRDRLGRTPLFAVLSAPADTARVLMQALLLAGANPEARAANGETPLGLALAKPELQHWLNWPQWKPPLRALRDADLVDAAAAGDVGAVEKLLALGLAADAVDARGAPALVRAAGQGHVGVVSCLLERGADPARSSAGGATALSAAVSAQQMEVLEALLRHGIAADQRLAGGITPLMIAAGLGLPPLIKRLLASGADVDAADDSGARALHAAAQFAFTGRDSDCARQTLELLLAAGATIDARNASGQSALTLLLGAHAPARTAADQKQLLTLLPLLLKRGADVNSQDHRGVGALHACAMHGLLLPARALIGSGADPQRLDILERTPREIAHLLGYIDVASELALPAVQGWRAPA